jgi:DNA helicase II / ATP-dependent DNA helicase PcrA
VITIEEFKTLVFELLGDNLDNNPSQLETIEHPSNDNLMITAGPGSGKTRVLVLRALRHVLVDDILPDNIVITTFTRKAAKELRTRWLDWGTTLLETLQLRHPDLDAHIEGSIDINRCRIDTLDSIAEQTLTENRLPGQVAPILLDESAAKLVLKRQAFRDIYRINQMQLDAFLGTFSFDGGIPNNQGEALSIVKDICERLVHDRVNLDRYAAVNQAHKLIVTILRTYQNYLRQTNLFDYSFLEQVFLERLQGTTLDEWCDGIHALLIDEYQDTNPLQEGIYFQIISKASPYLTVVGDDDQAMYRFRGGSVELFTQFIARCFTQIGRHTIRINMITNYRSSGEIVDFYNRHVVSDAQFIPARIIPTKPEVISSRGILDMPVLGLFRQDAQILARDLADWLDRLVNQRRIMVSNGADDYEIHLKQNGDLGDFVFLAHTVQEVKYDRFNGGAQIRFPGLFRQELENRALHVFNPRGRALRTILDVQRLLGLILLCLDPDDQYLNAIMPTNEARYFLNLWRREASNFISQNPRPSNRGGISRFVQDWQSVSRGQDNTNFPPDWPVLELIFTLITWISGFQNDPEHQVWLEAITRVIANAGMASPYGMQIFQSNRHRDLSRQSIIRDALFPIAENDIDVDEEIMPSVPRNYLQLMTIHQSKGLQFPLVIVDVGSHFLRNHSAQKFLRFPDTPSNVARLENDVEPFLESPLRIGRDPLDRTFDDLVRLYYVAFSRPQSILLIVGCENCLAYGSTTGGGAIPNIALGWLRNSVWPWRQPYIGRRPIRVDPPFLLI